MIPIEDLTGVTLAIEDTDGDDDDDEDDVDDDDDDYEDEDAAADNGDDVDADHEEELQPEWNERCSHLCFWRSTVKEGALL